MPGGYHRSSGEAEPSSEATDTEVAARLWDQTSRWVEQLT